MLIHTLKQLNTDKMLEVDELVEVSAFARTIEQEYTELELPVPGWLQDSVNILREEIAKRTRASDLAKLKDLENRLEGFKTVNEKRNEAQRELAALQKKLGMAPAKAGR